MKEQKLRSLLQTKLLETGFRVKPIRNAIFQYLDHYAFNSIVKGNTNHRLRKVQEDKYAMVSAIINAGKRGLNEKLIGENVSKRFFDNLFGKSFMKTNEHFYEFCEKYGMHPPSFLVLSPTAACNLRCEGCYANSSEAQRSTLPYSIVKRVLREKVDLWGSHFTVISGGEPFLYRSEGKNIFDIFKENLDQVFLVYTNGTLCDEETAKILGELGNVTPAISVEGFEEETDRRRGKGTFKKIVEGMEYLKKHGVPFGISTTATRENWDVLTDEKFWDFFFNQMGALYQWIFQYMPIGRSHRVDMMVTPEQRMKMYERTWRAIRERKYFIADFWNCGVASDGCISAGAAYGGGYIYVTWTGDVTPCVFNPFKVDNIIDVYKKGGNLNTVLFSPYFEDIRRWQRRYYDDKPLDEMGNLIAPCPIRDHFKELKQILIKHKAVPVDPVDTKLLQDGKLEEKIHEYDTAFMKLSDPVWEKDYIKANSNRD